MCESTGCRGNIRVSIYVQGDAMNLQKLEQIFLALGDKTRLRLLSLLSSGEICVCYFVDVLDEPQPKISRHLAYLRNAGLVDARRDGKWMHYRLSDSLAPEVEQLLRSAMNALEENREIQRDRAALLKACCAVKLPPTLRNAPKPALR
jgi:ArsR family transcriptional regulator